MQKKIIIAVAPTGGWGLGQDNPVAPEEIAEQAKACAEAGAAVVHMHARDAAGSLTADMTCFNRTVELIHAQTNIIIEASTGGISSMTSVERTYPAANPHAEIASLNIGTLNVGATYTFCPLLADTVREFMKKYPAASASPTPAANGAMKVTTPR